VLKTGDAIDDAQDESGRDACRKKQQGIEQSVAQPVHRRLTAELSGAHAVA